MILSSIQPAVGLADTETTGTPRTTSLSGSFVDEGLDVSQRLAESMFVGPELDPSAREVVTTAGVRVSQAVERVLDMLNNTVLQVSKESLNVVLNLTSSVTWHFV